jgi:hypothetical protein
MRRFAGDLESKKRPKSRRVRAFSRRKEQLHPLETKFEYHIRTTLYLMRQVFKSPVSRHEFRSRGEAYAVDQTKALRCQVSCRLFLSDDVLLSAGRRETDDRRAHPRTKSAGGAGNSLGGVGRADHDSPPLRRLCVLRRTSGENCSDRRDAEIRELVRVVERVPTEVDAEAVAIGFCDSLAVL